MRTLFIICLVLASAAAPAATDVEEKVEVSSESRLSLDLPFADEIRLETWNRKEVAVHAAVNINDGEQDDLFELKSRKTSNTIYIEMDADRWEDFSWNGMCNCKQTKIMYRVYFPASMAINAKTISGDFVLDYYSQQGRFKTVSGDIDLTIPANHGVDFRVKTVSGEVYSDLDIEYPEGRDGLNQFVGINVHGQAYGGGPLVNMQTVSGDIFLRKQ